MSLLEFPQYGLTVHQIGTTYYIPEITLLFDAPRGLSGRWGDNAPPSTVLISHLHADHCFGLPEILAQSNTKTVIYAPKENQNSLANFVQASYPNAIQTGHQFIGVCTGDTVKLKNNFYCKVYDLKHSCPLRGYGLHIVRTQLKKEYMGINRQQIIQLKRNGTQLTETVDQPILAYLGGTQDRGTWVSQYPFLLGEHEFPNTLHIGNN